MTLGYITNLNNHIKTNKMEVSNYINESIETLQLLGNEFDMVAMKEVGHVLVECCDKPGFIIPFDKVVVWLEFKQKAHAKRALLKNFTENIDFEILTSNPGENYMVGRNKEKIMLTANCFQKFCMKAGTHKADIVRQFYIEILKGVKRFRAAIDNGELGIVVLEQTENTTKSLELARMRIDLAKSHPTLRALIARIFGVQVWKIAQVYSTLNKCVSGVTKKTIGDKIGKKNSQFIHRDYMSKQQVKTLDSIVETIIHGIEKNIDEFVDSPDTLLPYVEKVCSDIQNYCAVHLHNTLPNDKETVMTLTDARLVESTRHKRPRLK